MSVSPSQRANAVRFLAIDAVQKANSGHPGAPMGMADMAEVLWNEFLSHNPANPQWSNRDRFVLSNGHASMMLYALLHLTGYDLPLDELKHFRQFHSKTPGHPEFRYTPGVETTTGPLGQGIANAIGMALGEKMMAAQFNRPGFEVVDHYTYTVLGDGCMMEGISHEVCSLAGTWKLNKLIALYDDNGISIDGHVEKWFGDDTPKRFEAYGWHVIRNVDGHNPNEIRAALETARKQKERPTLVCCKTVIGKGSPNKAGTHDVHGAPLGADEIAATRVALDWHHPAFEVPADIRASWDAKARGAQREGAWATLFAAYKKAHPELAAEFERRVAGNLPSGFEKRSVDAIRAAQDKAENIATRVGSQRALNAFGPELPELIGGSADLTPSNNTFWSGSHDFAPETPAGNYVRYGVREFGMCAIMNGISLYGGLIPYAGTFLMFSDYARNALRMAALMKLRNIYVFTHDSIGLGEDGPTHQPVEQISSLRLIPNLDVWRPCDVPETLVAWQQALLRKDGPAVLALSRQNLPVIPRNGEQLQAIAKGGYVLVDCDGTPDIVLIATGSEIAIAVEAAKVMKNNSVRVVSMPCADAFGRQPQNYRDAVLPPNCKALAIEAGVSNGWYQYADAVIGLDSFGESAPAGQLFEHFGFTAAHIASKAEAMLKK